MKLTPQQLKANDDFFNRISSIAKMYVWPDTGHVYKIQEGCFICDSPESFNTLKDNTSKSFHHKIKMK